MSLADEQRFHEAAVRDAAAAVDAARASGDALAEAAAVQQLEAADRARQQFIQKLQRATSGDLDDYDDNRAPGRRFWESRQ